MWFRILKFTGRWCQGLQINSLCTTIPRGGRQADLRVGQTVYTVLSIIGLNLLSFNRGPERCVIATCLPRKFTSISSRLQPAVSYESQKYIRFCWSSIRPVCWLLTYINVNLTLYLIGEVPDRTGTETNTITGVSS